MIQHFLLHHKLGKIIPNRKLQTGVRDSKTIFTDLLQCLLHRHAKILLQEDDTIMETFKTMTCRKSVIVIDFGGQYNQLVARRVRECNVYCEIYSYKTDIEKIKAMNPKGIILTGGPNSCYEADSPTYTKELFELGIPVLGLCYGAQLMQHILGGKVERAEVREYGKTEVFVENSSKLFSQRIPINNLLDEPF